MVVALLAVSASFSACHNYKEDAERLEREKQELIAQGNYKDSTITSFIGAMNEIEGNINSISGIQEKLNQNAAETNPEVKDDQLARINEDVKAINQLLEDNKQKIAVLNKKLKASGNKNKELEKMIAALNETIVQKDQQLAELNQKLTEMSAQIDKLNADVQTLVVQNSERQTKIDDQTARLHTAYYTTGTSKELFTKKVINKEGGFLGIGRTKQLKQNFDNKAFTKVDITQTSSIAINAKNAKLLTNHPSDSYTMNRNDKMVSDLVITNPDKFWEASKYLVVQVDK